MINSEYQLAIFGTFDVENYGDLLFPLIAEAELSKRLGAIKLHRFSYHAKNSAEWPYEVTSVTELPQLINSLDGVLIGGGHIIRFDKEIAPGYIPPASSIIHHPTGYWLTPALIALQHGVPVVWNAPGLHENDIPGWADDLVKLALEHSRYVAVRDELSRAALARLVDADHIAVVPDTGFGLSRLVDGEHPSPAFNELRQSLGLADRYIIIQATHGLESFLNFLKRYSNLFGDFQFLALPLGPVLGDHNPIIENAFPGVICLPAWPTPLLLAELISHATAVVGYSYHLAITALAFGVPVFTSAPLSVGKYTALATFEKIFPLPTDGEIDPEWFISKLGKTELLPGVDRALDQLAHHWDRIATIFRAGAVDTQPVVNRFWQSLPYLLETRMSGDIETQVELATKERSIQESNRLLSLARAEILHRDNQIVSLYNSRSWKITLPLRFLLSKLKQLWRYRGDL